MGDVRLGVDFVAYITTTIGFRVEILGNFLAKPLKTSGLFTWRAENGGELANATSP